MNRLRLLYALVYFINYFYSQWGWRLLHCYISLSVGFAKYNSSGRLFSFLLFYWLTLELICNKYLFLFSDYYKMGQKILQEILEEIKKKKSDD